ncbi:hypothetical protein [Nocardioides bruguierae]|uniref:Uncharacterized protein n=1 Tax=Nocardioides bruguierae TaxID=2945102 RepID=A0A9X2IEM8_9ACTN|nr:hypothetical protein [Nocardioides bruguierae]MCM0618775.1 hypothetical protein [Nocardioides bruguierae]
MTALGTRLLTITVDGEDYTAQASNVRITGAPADSDFVSFEDAANGGKREYKLAFTAVQDPATGSLWDLLWSQAGSTVPVVVKPAGGTTASEATPHFTGNVVITEPDGDLLGGEANASTSARFTFDAEWTYAAKPVRVTA